MSDRLYAFIEALARAADSQAPPRNANASVEPYTIIPAAATNARPIKPLPVQRIAIHPPAATTRTRLAVAQTGQIGHHVHDDVRRRESEQRRDDGPLEKKPRPRCAGLFNNGRRRGNHVSELERLSGHAALFRSCFYRWH